MPTNKIAKNQSTCCQDASSDRQRIDLDNFINIFAYKYWHQEEITSCFSFPRELKPQQKLSPLFVGRSPRVLLLMPIIPTHHNT